ncbi:MAG: tetrathionate reductase family octaheme c-type cytochrome [Mariniphaga sp.]|nr:tetrathionate reductase family octaheme c-type cytochrome [Mariniphaga sp.]
MQMIKKPGNNFIKFLILFLAIIIPWIIGIVLVNKSADSEKKHPVKLVNYQRDTIQKADHSQFEILQVDFETPQQLTEVCLTCHNMTAQDVMKTSHWTWSKEYITDSGDTIQLGKKNNVNNFCIGVESNEARCTSCHIGYGWEDSDFDFTDGKNIDCIVCHDQTGTYMKFPTGAGFPVQETKKFGNRTFYPPDYKVIAQNVGKPSKQNCGVCHFFGGGGNNVKHGDLASELKEATKEVDVHMAVDGANLDCIDCHKTERHNITGNLYSIASTNTNRVLCEQCHTGQPHQNKIINKHTNKIACQTCHIPAYAKVSATKMYWDWSTAGKFNEDGSYLIKRDSAGNMIYHTMKGSFAWKNNVDPEYYWFNGNARHYLLGDQTDTTNSVQLNTLLGSYDDKTAKLIPVKVHAARQIWDPIFKTIILPHLFGKDSMAYWKNYDWNKAAEAGMKSVGLPYSGEYAFASSEMYWPINHMVAPSEEALQCSDCHSRESRLSNLTGFYLPGRDRSVFLDILGFALIVIAFTGVGIHTFLRLTRNK